MSSTETPTTFSKSTLVTVIATNERGAVLRKNRGEQRYECEMVDGTIAYFYGYELRETRLDEIDARRVDLELLEEAPQVAPVEDRTWIAERDDTTTLSGNAYTDGDGNFSLAKLLWSDLANPEERRAWELDRDALLEELHTAERELATIKKSESAYALVRDRYFAILAQAHRKVARKSVALATHYANQPTV